ncbi:MAG: hypothetical protein HQK53_07375 [Oligoflexia bacterium]|nr:hypothetical protein [Oligoflexia bacterium]
MKNKAFQNKFHYVWISFITIFIFVTIDNVISPLIMPLHHFYNVPMPEILKLLSSCNLGIVIGTFLGPIILQHLKIFYTYLLAIVTFSLFLLLFVFIKNFNIALGVRFFLGISSGLFASCYWWLTFDEEKLSHNKDAMISVLLSARPLAISLGVPLLVASTIGIHWQLSFLLYGMILLLVNIPFICSIKGLESTRSTSVSRNIFSDYATTLRAPNFYNYYFSLFLISIPYFGFYSLSGYWFLSLFNRSPISLSAIFLCIGCGEVIATLCAPLLNKKYSSATLFSAMSLIGIVSYTLFIFSTTNLYLTLLGIFCFLISNRIYLFILTKKLPVIFPNHPNKATLGSLSTLISWAGFAGISYLQSQLLPIIDLPTIGLLMFTALLLGLWNFYAKLSKFITSNITSNY